MAKDVMKTLEMILQAHGCLSAEQSKLFVLDMIKQRRYVQDIWS